MNNIDYHIRFASTLIVSAIEKHDDWEDLGPHPYRRGKRYWHSKSTGEIRVQIIRPRTPSKKQTHDKFVEKNNSFDGENHGQNKEEMMKKLSKMKRFLRGVDFTIGQHNAEVDNLEDIISNPEFEGDVEKVDSLLYQRKDIVDKLRMVRTSIKDKIVAIRANMMSSAPEFSDIKTKGVMWEGTSREKIDRVLDADVEGERGGGNRRENSTGINTTFFDFDGNGNGSVFKPVKKVGRFQQEGTAKNEVMSSLISDAIGLDVVPPTKMVTKAVDGTKHSRLGTNSTLYMDGSSQLMVPGKTLAELRKQSMELYTESANFRKSIQKMAIFDFLTGARDRHDSNLMVDLDGQVAYGIDNGFSLGGNATDIEGCLGEFEQMITFGGGLDDGLIKAIHESIKANADKINDLFDSDPKLYKRTKDAFWENVGNLYSGGKSRLNDNIKMTIGTLTQ